MWLILYLYWTVLVQSINYVREEKDEMSTQIEKEDALEQIEKETLPINTPKEFLIIPQQEGIINQDAHSGWPNLTVCGSPSVMWIQSF